MRQHTLIDADPEAFPPSWRDALHAGIRALVSSPEIAQNINPAHISGTPDRVVKFYEQFLYGYGLQVAEVLSANHAPEPQFPEEQYDQMIVVRDIPFDSLCAHHLLFFRGRASFGYLPAKRIVGLSKVARLVDMFAHRLQLQEQMTQLVVDAFFTAVRPHGCGLVIEAEHECMACRGVEKVGVLTVTSALAGSFLQPDVKQEFLSLVRSK